MNRLSPVHAQARVSSWLVFMAMAAASLAALTAVGMVFVGDRIGAHLGRFAGYLVIVALLAGGSIRLLRRDGLPADAFGLSPSLPHARAFLIGTLGACFLIVLLIGGVYVAAPFEWRAGARPSGSVALEGLRYLAGNAGEELLFRGYALVALARSIGTTRALWVLALPFGLFHAPGLDAMALAKMMLTTGAMHFVFAYAYIGTRSLWAALALHAFGNLLLHAVSGLGQGDSAFALDLEQPLPAEFDLPFVVFFSVSAGCAFLLSRLPAVRRGAEWLQGRQAA